MDQCIPTSLYHHLTLESKKINKSTNVTTLTTKVHVTRQLNKIENNTKKVSFAVGQFWIRVHITLERQILFLPMRGVRYEVLHSRRNLQSPCSWVFDSIIFFKHYCGCPKVSNTILCKSPKKFKLPRINEESLSCNVLITYFPVGPLWGQVNTCTCHYRRFVLETQRSEVKATE